MERSRKCVCTTLDDILKFPPLLTGFDIFHFHPQAHGWDSLHFPSPGSSFVPEVPRTSGQDLGFGSRLHKSYRGRDIRCIFSLTFTL